jgi:5-methylcytosine-specific restriction endonuclease McrA
MAPAVHFLGPSWYSQTMARTMMKERDVYTRMQLLRRWDFQCVLCGHSFHDITSVSIEHIIPKSMGGTKNKGNKKHRAMGNLGPSHYNCNNFRGSRSLLEAARMLARKHRVMGPKAFDSWINKKIPGRNVPNRFMALHVGRPLGCLELPERLPGLM